MKIKSKVVGPIPDLDTPTSAVPVGDCVHRDFGLFAIDLQRKQPTGTLKFLQLSAAEIVCVQELRVAVATVGALFDTLAAALEKPGEIQHLKQLLKDDQSAE